MPQMNLQLSEPRMRQVSDDEINRRFDLAMGNSGRLVIPNKVTKEEHVYENVCPKQIKRQSPLGSGTFGVVTKVNFGIWPMAEKTMSRTDDKQVSKKILADLSVVRRTEECPYIVQCYGYIITQFEVRIYMEPMAKCCETLLEERGKVGLPEQVIAKIALSVTRALQFLKEKLSLIHRDLKPSNILLNWNDHVKLCDFGISGELIDSSIAGTTSSGAVTYLAPERIKHTQYGTRADVWSLGMTLVHLAQGSFPYEHYGVQTSHNQFEMMTKIEVCPPPRLDSEKFSPEFCEFVAKCLEKEAKNRPRFKELLEVEFLVNAAKSDFDMDDFLDSPELYEPKPGTNSN